MLKKPASVHTDMKLARYIPVRPEVLNNLSRDIPEGPEVPDWDPLMG